MPALINRSGILILSHLQQLRCLIGGDAGVDDFLDIAVHDLIQLVNRQIDPVVGHTALREIVGPDFFRAVAGSHLALAQFRLRIVCFLLLDII